MAVENYLCTNKDIFFVVYFLSFYFILGCADENSTEVNIWTICQGSTYINLFLTQLHKLLENHQQDGHGALMLYSVILVMPELIHD